MIGGNLSKHGFLRMGHILTGFSFLHKNGNLQKRVCWVGFRLVKLDPIIHRVRIVG